jgi:hypothetical protein
MTFSPAQWNKIYTRLPKILGDVSIEPHRSRRMFLDDGANFPIMNVLVVSQVPLTQEQQIHEEYDAATKTVKVTRGAQWKARISCGLYGPDQQELEALADSLATTISSTGLYLVPGTDEMQFRGCDPPTTPVPYNANGTIFQTFIDFSVEYRFKWIWTHPPISKFNIEIGNMPSPIILHGRWEYYSVDIDLSSENSVVAFADIVLI